MKRDMELIRELMLAIDSRDDNEYWAGDLEVSGDRNIDQINYHLQLLIDAGFIEAKVARDNDGISITIDRMSWDGHEFLDNARNESVWKDTMKIVAEKGGSVAVGLLTQLLTSVAKQHLGLG
jgi:Hypothetical protein (DUF2513)